VEDAVARISFRLPDDISDPDCRGWLEAAIAAGKPGPEFQAIRAHSPGVMRSFTETRNWIYHKGALDFGLKEIVRAYIALSGDCSYCSNQGVARGINADREQLDALLNYHKSDKYSARERLAFRYADAIMWNPSEADNAMWAELLDEFTEEEIVELGYWIGFTFGGQRFLKTLGATQGQLQEALNAAGSRSRVHAASTTSD
jgi:alkylhydroperoxidase family enzyme